MLNIYQNGEIMVLVIGGTKGGSGTTLLAPHLNAYAILNKAFSRGSDNAEAAAILQEYPDHWIYLETLIGNRKAFSNAFGGGQAVMEYQPKDTKALKEMRALYRHLFDTT